MDVYTTYYLQYNAKKITSNTHGEGRGWGPVKVYAQFSQQTDTKDR